MVKATRLRVRYCGSAAYHTNYPKAVSAFATFPRIPVSAFGHFPEIRRRRSTTPKSRRAGISRKRRQKHIGTGRRVSRRIGMPRSHPPPTLDGAKCQNRIRGRSCATPAKRRLFARGPRSCRAMTSAVFDAFSELRYGAGFLSTAR